MTLPGRLSLATGLMIALTALVSAFAANNLTQIDVVQNSDGSNNLRQIGIALHDGYTYVAGDGSVRTIPGDGSVRFVSIGEGTQETYCFHNVRTVGAGGAPAVISDGTSNTIFLSETASFSLLPTIESGLGSGGVRSIYDGTSNTITFAETSQFCAGTTNTPPNNAPAGSNVYLGGNSSFDLCVGSAGISAPILDGTSNTITFGETRSSVCFGDIVVDPNVQVTIIATPEPDALALLLPAMLGLTVVGHGMQRRLSRGP